MQARDDGLATTESAARLLLSLAVEVDLPEHGGSFRRDQPQDRLEGFPFLQVARRGAAIREAFQRSDPAPRMPATNRDTTTPGQPRRVLGGQAMQDRPEDAPPSIGAKEDTPAGVEPRGSLDQPEERRAVKVRCQVGPAARVGPGQMQRESDMRGGQGHRSGSQKLSGFLMPSSPRFGTQYQNQNVYCGARPTADYQ